MDGGHNDTAVQRWVINGTLIQFFDGSTFVTYVVVRVKREAHLAAKTTTSVDNGFFLGGQE